MAIYGGPDAVSGEQCAVSVGDVFGHGSHDGMQVTNEDLRRVREKRRPLLLAVVLAVLTAAVVGLVLVIGPVVSAIGGCSSVMGR